MAERESTPRKAISISLNVFLILGTLSISGHSSQNSRPAPQSKVQAGPNLVPLLHSPMSEEIRIRNLGSEPSAPSKVTLDCVRVGATPETNSCPDLPPSAAASYFDPAFPQHATIQVPSLAPGATFTHKLAFWGAMNWPKGKYKFTAVVRMSDSPRETITKDRVAVGILTVP
jgi:hypothetical protein